MLLGMRYIRIRYKDNNMVSGIYQLTFSNGKRYIGKSIDIDRRWQEHNTNFKNKKAASKLQSEFEIYGYPRGEVLLKCHRDHIDILEVYLIATLRPELNTRVELPISTEDYDALMQQKQLLEDSTVDHIKLIDALATDIEGMQEQAQQQDAYIAELEKDVELEKLSVESYENFIREAEKHAITKAEYDLKLRCIENALATEKSKTWLQKLFNR